MNDHGVRARIGLKRSHIAVSVILAVSMVTTSIVLYEMHNTKRIYRVMFADDEIIVSDGGGFYLVPETIRMVHESNLITIDMRQITRHVQINFLHGKWKDIGLRDIISKHITTSKLYHIYFLFGILDENPYNSKDDIKVGDRIEITGLINIDVFEEDNLDNRWLLELYRYHNENDTPTYVPRELYDEGYAELVREDEDVWVLDIDTWFRAIDRSGITYFVRLSMRITFEYRPLI